MITGADSLKGRLAAGNIWNKVCEEWPKVEESAEFLLRNDRERKIHISKITHSRLLSTLLNHFTTKMLEKTENRITN